MAPLYPLRWALLALLFLAASSETFSASILRVGPPASPSFRPVQIEQRLLEQSGGQNSTNEAILNETGQTSEDDEGSGEVIVSPEFALHNLSHAHGESEDSTGDVFESYITLAFNELRGYVPGEPVTTPSIAPALPVSQLDPSDQSTENDDSRIPNLSELRNINIDELPETFP